MVSILWGVIALSLGILVYLLPATFAPLLPIDLREKIGDFYYRNAMRSFRQVAIVRRTLGGVELIPISVDDEQKLAKATLSSGMLSDDKKLPFKDPDNRIKRLYQKPAAVVCEAVPAAIDAELAELGYWVRQHATSTGLERDGKINPYVRVTDGLRVVDPVDILGLVTKDVEPENIETATELTKRRFDKYGSKIGAAETVATLMGFGAGVGGVGLLTYLNQKILDGGGAGKPTNPLPPVGTVLPPVDVLPANLLVVVDAMQGVAF